MISKWQSLTAHSGCWEPEGRENGFQHAAAKPTQDQNNLRLERGRWETLLDQKVNSEEERGTGCWELGLILYYCQSIKEGRK